MSEFIEYKEGEWFICGNTFALIDTIHPKYIELPDLLTPYRSDPELSWYFHTDEIVLGDFVCRMAIARRFIWENGNLVKSHKLIVCGLDGFSMSYKLEPGNQEMIDKAIAEHPKEFKALMSMKKEFKYYYTHTYHMNYPGFDREMAVFFKEIRSQLPEMFTTSELNEVMIKNNCPFTLDQSYNFRHEPSFELGFFYTTGNYRGKETLLTNVKVLGFD